MFPSTCCRADPRPRFSLPTQRCFRGCSGASRSASTFLCLRRGVSFSYSEKGIELSLFSAYAEVFLCGVLLSGCASTFLCLRRGVSIVLYVTTKTRAFSLPTQRCFSEEVHTKATAHTFLCLRRGVSILDLFLCLSVAFSLPTQRCFLGFRIDATTGAAFLCLRRGVSPRRSPSSPMPSFSLPTQRCFPPIVVGLSHVVLFSAYAEVFLAYAMTSRDIITFLCLRRGVSQPPNRLKSCEVFSLPTQRCF